MTTMTRFVPLRSSFEDVAGLQKRLNQIFNDFAGESSVASAGFVPAVDVYEDAEKLVLKLEIPGVKPEDVDIKLENQTLVIKGERKFESSEKPENFHRIERRFGSFVRSFTLPQTVNTESVSATTDAGVLTISLAKKAEAQPKQIKVEVAKQVEPQAAQKYGDRAGVFLRERRGGRLPSPFFSGGECRETDFSRLPRIVSENPQVKVGSPVSPEVLEGPTGDDEKEGSEIQRK